MRIAVNTRFLEKDRLEGVGYFLYEHLSRITTSHPEHEFIFIFDRPYDERFIFGENVKAVVTGPAARHPILWKLWYDVKVPRVLRKYKADVFVTCDGFCSLATKVPQCLVIHDLAFLHYPRFIPRGQLLYYRYFTPRFIEAASSVVTVSEFSKADIMKQYGVDPAKLTVIPNAARTSFVQLDYAEREMVKMKYTEGREYFICAGSIHPRKNLMNLLKAFSVFKKRQKSNWKLVLAGRLAWKYQDFLQAMKTYKYREDVLMTGYIGEMELAKLTASAYAMVYPSLLEGFGIPVVEAMQCGVPVITTKGSSMEEIAGEAALYADASNYQDIGEKMMLIYKDEQLRARLVSAGITRSSKFDWENSARAFWECISKTVNSKV